MTKPPPWGDEAPRPARNFHQTQAMTKPPQNLQEEEAPTWGDEAPRPARDPEPGSNAEGWPDEGLEGGDMSKNWSEGYVPPNLRSALLESNQSALPLGLE